jgi:protein TonB
MPHDMFADAVVRPSSPKARQRRRLLTLFSIGLHFVIAVPIVTLQLLSPGPLPNTRQPVLFQFPSIVKLIDIPIARPRGTTPQNAGAPAEPPNPNVAPTQAPEGVQPETARPGPATGPDNNIFGDFLGGVPVQLPGQGAVPGPPPPPRAPDEIIRLRSGMQQPRKVVDVQPVYPPIAVTVHKEGVVILEAILDARGNVTSVHVLRSIPLLDDAAVDAVRQWKYTPAMLNGVPVPVIMTITVNFSLR